MIWIKNKDIGNGLLLILIGGYAIWGDIGLFDMIALNTLAIFMLGVNFIFDGISDKSGKDVRSIKKKLRKIERSSDTNSDDLSELYMMVVKTQNVLDYKFRMFIEVCLIQFENLTEEWQNHFMMSAEFSSLHEKAFRNAGLLTREEKKKFVQWMNKALESLDQDTIREFAFSDDFRLYKEIIELYSD